MTLSFSSALNIGYGQIVKDYFDFSGVDLGDYPTKEMWQEVETTLQMETATRWREGGFRQSDADEFYRTDRKYLEELVAFYARGISSKAIPLLLATEHNHRVLDFGSGVGVDSLIMGLTGHDSYAYDLSSEHNSFARWRNIRHHGRVQFSNDWDYTKRFRFDAIYSFETMEHMDDPYSALEDLCNMTDRLIMQWSFEDVPDFPIHFNHDDEKMQHILGVNGFHQEHSEVSEMVGCPRIWIR